MTEHVQIQTEGSLVKIHLNRPEKKNALTVEMYTAIAEAIETANEDASVRAVLFSAEGESYCAGNDLQDFMARPPTGPDSPVLRFLKALRESEVALIAAVQGKAVGVGATMLLHMDHVVLTPDAELHFNFIKMALVPEAASSMLLPQYIGRQRAAEILMTGRPVLAEEALATGLAAHIADPKDAISTAMSFANQISNLAPAALRETKRLMQRPTEDLRARMDAENLMFMQRLSSPEFAEAVSAFMQKRPPNFG